MLASKKFSNPFTDLEKNIEFETYIYSWNNNSTTNKNPITQIYLNHVFHGREKHGWDYIRK